MLYLVLYLELDQLLGSQSFPILDSQHLFDEFFDALTNFDITREPQNSIIYERN